MTSSSRTPCAPLPNKVRLASCAQRRGGRDWLAGAIQTFEAEVDRLAALPTAKGAPNSPTRPNTFVVFPFCDKILGDYSLFKEFYVAAVGRAGASVGTFQDFDTDHALQCMPFHPSEKFAQGWAPWPTLHLLRRCDLDRARRGGDEVSRQISLRNRATLENLGGLAVIRAREAIYAGDGGGVQKGGSLPRMFVSGDTTDENAELHSDFDSDSEDAPSSYSRSSSP